MARTKKHGRRARGIQEKKGFLYIVISQPVIKDGKKISEKKWVSTNLIDTPENVSKAIEMREHLIKNKTISTVDRNISLSEYADYVLEKKKREVADTTYASYEYRAKRIKESFGAIKTKDIREGMVERFLDDLLESEHLQGRSVDDIKTLFSAIMGFAEKEGIISYNPVKEVKLNKGLVDKNAKTKKPDEEFFSYKEAQLFLEKIKGHDLYEFYYLTLFFGLRREEILGLRWTAINFQNGTMVINHTVTKGTKVVRKNTTKTEESTRRYPLTDTQVEMFKILKERETRNRKMFGKGYCENEYIFKHKDGTPYYPDHPSKMFRKIIKRIPELPQSITFHGLRSSCVSILVHMGMDVKSIQKWVGHKDIDTTLKIYAKVKDKEAKEEISNAMNNIIPLREYNQK